jgi:hypothetical protein
VLAKRDLVQAGLANQVEAAAQAGRMRTTPRRQGSREAATRQASDRRDLSDSDSEGAEKVYDRIRADTTDVAKIAATPVSMPSTSRR